MAIPQKNPFVQFKVSGSFNNSEKASLSGWFIVNGNNGHVVRADIFHGARALASLPITELAWGGDYSLYLSNSQHDTLSLIFAAPNNDGSLADYRGGDICSNLSLDCEGFESVFFGGYVSYETEDLVYVGSISNAGPVPIVGIAIKPHGDGTALINPRSHVLSTIAIISSRKFDALAEIDTQALTFGPTGTEQSITSCDKGGRDVNNDQVPDLICHFNSRLTRFLPSESLGILVGKTLQGSPFIGLEKVVVKPLWDRR